MGIFDTFWNIEQERRIGELQRKLVKLEMEQDFDAPTQVKIKELTEQNLQLKFRLGILIRLLISKGVMTAEEYTSYFDRFATRDAADS